jgi:hypothetical protein
VSRLAPRRLAQGFARSACAGANALLAPGVVPLETDAGDLRPVPHPYEACTIARAEYSAGRDRDRDPGLRPKRGQLTVERASAAFSPSTRLLAASGRYDRPAGRSTFIERAFAPQLDIPWRIRTILFRLACETIGIILTRMAHDGANKRRVERQETVQSIQKLARAITCIRAKARFRSARYGALCATYSRIHCCQRCIFAM